MDIERKKYIMSKEDWKKLGYTDEESEELENLNGINANSVGDIDIETVNITLEKEKEIMGNNTDFEKALGKKNANVGEAIVNARADLGKSLKDSLADACDKFSQWMEASQVVLKAFNEAKVGIEAMKELDNTMVEMQKVSEDTITQLGNE